MNEEHLQQAELAAAGKFSQAQSNGPMSQALHIISQLQRGFAQVTATALIQPGEQWGHLEIKGLLGQGGMGEVYAAHDTLLNRPVAVKFLGAQSAGLISAEEFINEARHMAQIRHPHVMAVYGANTFADIPGFWGELLQGSTLDQIAVEDLHWSSILPWAEQLADAVGAIHEQGLIHGDIKPQNVILEPDKGVVLMDFGSVQDHHNEASQWRSSTPLIMAPELFTGHSKTPSSDVYALGVVFYCLSHQQRYPHHADNWQQLQQQLSQTIRFNNTTGPHRWQRLLRHMLHPEQQQRPSIQQVQNTIKQLTEAPIKRRKRVLLGVAASVLLAFTAYLQHSNQRLNAANQEVQAALEQATQFNQLLQDMLASVSNINHGKDLLMKDAIEQFQSGILSSEPISDGIKARAMTTLATSLFTLGEQDRAIEVLLAIKQLPALPLQARMQVDIKQAMFLMRHQQLDQSKIQQASEIMAAIKLNPALTKLPKAAMADWHQANLLLATNQLQFDQALQHGQAALALWQQAPAGRNQWLHLGTTLDLLGSVHNELGNWSQAEQLYLQALAYFQQANPKPNANTMTVRNNLAINYAAMGKTEQALQQMAQLVESSGVFFGREHIRYFIQISNQAAALWDNGMHSASLSLLEKHWPDLIQHHGAHSMVALFFQSTMANNLKSLQRFDEAETAYLMLLAEIESRLGKNHPNWYVNQANLSELYLETQRPQRALDLLEPMREAVQQTFGQTSELTQFVLQLHQQATQALADDSATSQPQ